MIASDPMLPAIISPELMPMPMFKLRPSFAPPRLVQPIERLRHVEGRADRVVGMPVVGEGGAEQPHHHVPDELIERSPVPEQDLDHRAKILVQLADDGLGRGLFRGGGEAANIGKQHRHVALLATQPDERRDRPSTGR